MNRRGFLKLLGVGAAAAVVAPALVAAPSLVVPTPAAPLFVPARNLDFGVPHRILTATELPAAATRAPTYADVMAYVDAQAPARMAGTVPMLMVQDNYVREWGGLVRAGAHVLVDPVTAARWQANGVAVSPSSTTMLTWSNVRRTTAEDWVLVLPRRRLPSGEST